MFTMPMFGIFSFQHTIIYMTWQLNFHFNILYQHIGPHNTQIYQIQIISYQFYLVYQDQPKAKREFQARTLNNWTV